MLCDNLFDLVEASGKHLVFRLFKVVVQSNSMNSDNIDLVEIRGRLVLLLLVQQHLFWFYTLKVIAYLAKVVLGRDLVCSFQSKPCLKRGLWFHRSSFLDIS